MQSLVRVVKVRNKHNNYMLYRLYCHIKISNNQPNGLYDLLLILVILYIPLIITIPLLYFWRRINIINYLTSPIIFLDTFICNQLILTFGNSCVPFLDAIGYILLFVLVIATLALMRLFPKYKIITISLLSCYSFWQTILGIWLANILMEQF
jgi:hypothetical protein